MRRGCLWLIVCLLVQSPTYAGPAKVKIVGLGAASCGRFLADVNGNPAAQREYLAWAQGFISAILLTRPAGVDEQLDLLPPSLPLASQLQFLLERCAASPDGDFSEAVEALYRRLREVGSV